MPYGEVKVKEKVQVGPEMLRKWSPDSVKVLRTNSDDSRLLYMTWKRPPPLESSVGSPRALFGSVNGSLRPRSPRKQVRRNWHVR